MHFKPANFSFMMAVAAFLWTAQALSAQAASVIIDPSGPIIIDDFNTALDGTTQSGAGILGQRTSFAGSGNSINIGGGVAEFSADTFFDAVLDYQIDIDGFGYDLTQGGANTHLSLSDGVLSDPLLDLNNELFWPSFVLQIFAEGGGMFAFYEVNFDPSMSELPPLTSINNVLNLGTLLVAFTDFTQPAGFSFADVQSVGFSLFSGEDPNLSFSGPFAAVSVVPIPAALPLFLTGLAGLGFMGRRRKRRQAG